MGLEIVIGVSGDIRGHSDSKAQGKGLCQVSLTAWEGEVGGHGTKWSCPMGSGWTSLLLSCPKL